MADETTAVPVAGRPQMPDGYGIPESNDGLLPWRYVDEQMGQSKNYWLCTVRPDGRPHSVPLWAAWVDGVLYYDGAPDTIHNRNVAANPNVSVHLEDGTTAVILEGVHYRYVQGQTVGDGFEAIGNLVGWNALFRGLEYHESGRVQSVRWSQGQTVLDGVVIGTLPKPYRVNILFSGGDPTRPVVGVCSCAVHLNCKHALKCRQEVQAGEQFRTAIRISPFPSIPLDPLIPFPESSSLINHTHRCTPAVRNHIGKTCTPRAH